MRQPADWIVADWPAPKNVRTLVTTRHGGVSTGPYASMNLGAFLADDVQTVKANRSILRRHLPAEPKWLRQIHGTDVIDADATQGLVLADASVARKANTVCAITTADCIPVLFCNQTGTVVAAAHAGWRGLCAGVLENTVQAMECKTAEVLAYFGPAIGPRSFEVGAEVREAFLLRDALAASAFREKADGKFLADIYELARQRLRKAGVTQFFGAGFCTYEDARFFSHRRDGVTGRMASLIWRE
ncbi:MAG: peptidoglycan editing factor PgeF [Burkholderiales bacterium]